MQFLKEYNIYYFAVYLIFIIIIILASVLKGKKWEYKTHINCSALMLMMIVFLLIPQEIKSDKKFSALAHQWIVKTILAYQIIITFIDLFWKRKKCERKSWRRAEPTPDSES